MPRIIAGGARGGIETRRARRVGCMIQIGIDLGGTKIEGIALAANGAVLARRARPDAARRLRRHGARDRRRWSAHSSRRPRSARDGGHRHARRHLAGDRPGQERQLDLAERAAAAAGPRARPGPQVRLANDANCFALSEASDGAARRGRGGVRRHHRHGHRRRRRRARRRCSRGPTPWRASGGTTRCRGRSRSELAGAGLLLRPARVHRDVPVRARAWRAITSA